VANQDSAYIVSSLKYRPQTFEDVVGQEHVSRTLRNALKRQRLANGYLFTGPRGVGKTTSARILAKAINCENPQDGNPCNVCNHCIEITAGRSIDVLEVDGASTRGIDAIRELREIVKYPPANSNYRVYIIDEVHMLTKEAFNALLKTLEEPPPQVLFIFATTEPQKVPLTILSRCQRYDFRMIPTDKMIDRLKMISQAEGIRITEDGLALIVRKAAGSLRDSLSLLDQVSAFAEDEASLELVRRVLGVLDVTIYFELLDHIADQAADQVIDQANLLFSRGISVAEFLAGLNEHLRNLLIIKIVGKADYLDVSDADAAALNQQAQYFEERDLVRMQTLVTETIRDQRFVSNQTVSAELLLLKLTLSTRALELDALLSGKPAVPPKRPSIANRAKKSHTAPVPAAPKPTSQRKTAGDAEQVDRPSVPSQPKPESTHVKETTPKGITPREKAPAEQASVEQTPAADLDQITAHWEDFIQKLGTVGRSTGTFMSEGSPVAIVGSKLKVAFAQGQTYQIQTLTRQLKDIQRIACEVFKSELTIDLQVQDGQKPKSRQEDAVLAHPNSQHLLDIFDGEIVDK